MPVDSLPFAQRYDINLNAGGAVHRAWFGGGEDVHEPIAAVRRDIVHACWPKIVSQDNATLVISQCNMNLYSGFNATFVSNNTCNISRLLLDDYFSSLYCYIGNRARLRFPMYNT